MEWKTVRIRGGLLRRIEEKAERLGTNKSRAINKALEFLLLMGFFDYANPYEWLEAKVEEICGEPEIEEEGSEREAKREKEELREEAKEEKREEQKEGRIGIDVPLWEAEPKGEKREEHPKEEEDEDEEWTITF